MKIVWKTCESCDLAALDRIPRSWWMRWLFPSLRHYHCRTCQKNVMAPKAAVEAKRWSMTTFKNLPPAPGINEGGQR